jgi:hypothetical protein
VPKRDPWLYLRSFLNKKSNQFPIRDIVTG